jgi:hypothetical protein
MSVQVMYRNPQAGTNAAPVYAQGGYEALVRTLIGKDLTRVYDFSDNQLIENSSSPNEHWRVAWEHY